MEGQIEGEWVEVALNNRRVGQVSMHVTINIIGNISFIYIFKLIFTSIKLYIFNDLKMHIAIGHYCDFHRQRDKVGISVYKSMGGTNGSFDNTLSKCLNCVKARNMDEGYNEC